MTTPWSHIALDTRAAYAEACEREVALLKLLDRLEAMPDRIIEKRGRVEAELRELQDALYSCAAARRRGW